MPKFLSDINATKTINIDFTTSNDESRKLYWDNDNHTLSLEMGNGVIQQIGQEQLSEVRNSTGSTILNGTVVMITGSVGESGRLTVTPSINNGSIHSREIVGITTHDILTGEDGIVTSFGLVRDIPISIKPAGETWAAGQRLYTNPTIIGGMTNIEPSAPNLKVTIGQVVYVDATKVSVFIRLSHGSYLGGDNNVQFTNLATNNAIIYNGTLNRWENIPFTNVPIIAAQTSIQDSGNYYDEINVESVLQEIGLETVIQNRYLLNTMSTGVTEYGGIIVNASTNTAFDVGPVVGYIVDNETDPDNPTITRVEYAGQTGLNTPYLLTSPQTTVYLNAAGQITLDPSASGTAQSRRENLILGRLIHNDNTIIRAVENWPIPAIAPNSQLRDLWRAMGPINENVYVYPNGTNLNLSLNGGGLHYNGVNFANDNHNPTRLAIQAQTTLTFGYRTRTGTIVSDVTLVDPTSYDNNGVITTIAAVPQYSTNQRVFLTRSGAIRIQYGQTVYSTLANAIAAIGTEPFVLAPTLTGNSILIGVISLERGTTALNSATVRFTSASKFGELGGGGAGAGAAVNAENVNLTDVGNYFTSSNAEGALQEIGYSLANIIDTNTISIVTAGTGIDTAVVESPAQTFTYTVSHEDTSTLSGVYGTEGIQSVTLDGMGHVTGVTTNTYLTSSTQSKDFGTIIISDNDTGYTWSNSGSIVANSISDTFTLVSDGGIDINIDSTAYAIQISHKDTSSQGNVAYTNSSFVQSLNFDIYGHVISANSGTLQANDLLASIKTVDGPSSGLEADLLDGQHGNYYAPAMVSVLTKATGTYSLTNEYAILGNAIAGTVTLQLPSASTSSGKIYKIKKIDSSLNAITVSGDGTDTIDGQSSYSINYQYQAIDLVCDGSAWYIM